MTQFWKNPKFWITLIVILWLFYLIEGNLEQPVILYIIPHFLHPTVRIGTVIAASGVVGSLLTLAIQFSWRRRASKNAAASMAAAASSSKTVA